MNIDQNMITKKKDVTGKLRGYTYKITHILLFNSSSVANLVPYKSALFRLCFRTELKCLRFIATEI